MGTTIRQLTALDTVAAGDSVPVYSQTNGDTRRMSVSVLQSFMQTNLTFSGFTPQYSAPSATGFNVAVTAGSDNIWLILTPTGAFAAGTITLPAVAGIVAGQEVLVNCTQDVTTLTVAGNGATAVTGEPAGLSANDFFRLKYDEVTSTWYRVG